MASTLTQNEARTAATMLASCDGTDLVHARMVEALKLEYGATWDVERATDLLLARLTLDVAIEDAGVGA